MNEPVNAILLVGNGINRSFDGDDNSFIPQKGCWDFVNLSWNNIIKQILFNCNSEVEYDDIKSLPATLQIVIATKNDVKKSMKLLSDSMVADTISKEKEELCKQFLDLPFENILTTNYTYELEQAGGIIAGKYRYYQCRKDSIEVSKTIQKSRLYTYSDLMHINKKIWHIHGDVTTPDSVIIGHYYYGKLLRRIQNRIEKFMPYYKVCIKCGNDFKIKSWVDMFLTKDVYIVGFKFDYVEMDLWWLAACKKKEFPKTKIYYYAPKGEVMKDKRTLFDAYNIELCEKIEVKDNNYINYYQLVIEDIKEKLSKGDMR